MLQRRRHAPFLMCLAVVAGIVCAGCGAAPGHGQQASAAATATPTMSACGGSAASWAYADTVAQLKQKAQVIVVGTVLGTRAEQHAPCIIYTDATVRVDRTVNDPQHRVTGTTLVVTTAGGQLASGYSEWVEDEAKLGAGDQLVLFLAPDTAATYTVVDGEQGAIHIQDGLVHPGWSTSLIPLDAYIADIQQA